MVTNYHSHGGEGRGFKRERLVEMARRTIRCHTHCHHEGCKETAFWDCESRADYLRIEAKYARNWKCTRHSTPEQVLSIDQPKIVYEIASTRRETGLYWGSHGFVYGDGYKAFCGDFPEGTILRVTAEIVLPAESGGG